MRQVPFGDKDSSDMLKHFHQLLLDYYAENKPLGLGVPSVKYWASELAYSPRYLGDMILSGGVDVAMHKCRLYISRAAQIRQNKGSG